MRNIIFILLVSFSSLWGQEWQFVHLDSMETLETTNRRGVHQISFSAPPDYGLALAPMDFPEHPQRTWMQCDYWIDLQKPCEVFLAFGFYEGDSLRLWAGGYSLVEKAIIFGRVRQNGEGLLSLQSERQKPVEIRDLRGQYVFRFIFPNERQEIQLEVNGVPMIAALPFTQNQLSHFGYLLRNGTVRMFPLYFDGR